MAVTAPVFSDDDESSIDASLYKDTVSDLIMKVSFVKVDNQGVRDLLSDYGGKLAYKRFVPSYCQNTQTLDQSQAFF